MADLPNQPISVRERIHAIDAVTRREPSPHLPKCVMEQYESLHKSVLALKGSELHRLVNRNLPSRTSPR